MKTLIKILLALVLILNSCVSNRKRDLDKTNQSAYVQDETKEIVDISSSKQIAAKIDTNQTLLNQGLKIKSTGSDYEFRLGDFQFKGNADVELVNQKSETKIHHQYKTHVTYLTKTSFKTKTTYKTQTTYKSVKTDRKATPWYIFFVIGFFSKILLGLLWSWIKKQINY